MRTLLLSLLILCAIGVNLAQGPPVVPVVARKKIQTTDGRTVEGRVLNEGATDLQLFTDDNRIVLLRKTANDRFRVVTSQQDWPTYHGDVSGNRYTTMTQIAKGNVAKLTARWIFPMPNVTQIETTPIVVDGVMYASSANEVYALDAGTGRQLWHFRRPRTTGIAGNAAIGFNRGVAVSGNRLFMQTDNAHMIALNRMNGDLVWETEMEDWHQNYNGTCAPLVVGNLVISGTAEETKAFAALLLLMTLIRERKSGASGPCRIRVNPVRKPGREN
jgi:alcohol dehydrogenase (cytochrome c)